LGKEVFAEVNRGFEEGVVATLALGDEDGAVLAESGATLGPPSLEGGGAIFARGEGGEVDALEVGFEARSRRRVREERVTSFVRSTQRS